MGWVLTSLERLAEITRNELNKTGSPRNSTYMGRGVGYGHLTSWDLVLRYEMGLEWYCLYPNPNALQDLSSTLWVHGLVFLFLFVSLQNSLAWYCMENQVDLPTHLGHLPKPGLFPSIFTALPRKSFSVLRRHWEEWNLVQRKQKETEFSRFLFSRRMFRLPSHFSFPWVQLDWRGGLKRKGNRVQL